MSNLGLRKAHWLLALLTLRYDRAVERSWLAESLWPEQAIFAGDLDRALDCLRQSLAHLRKSLGYEVERIQSPRPRALFLDLQKSDVDIVAFDQAIRKGTTQSLERAMKLYRGPLLEGCGEPWVLPHREHYNRVYLDALEGLASDAKASHDDQSAIRYLYLAARADPAREVTHRALMDVLSRSGDYNAASDVYRTLRDYLHQQSNANPSIETTELYHRIREEARSKAGNSSPAASPQEMRPPHQNIPRLLTPLIGREEELREIRKSLQHSRLVTLAGVGGIGKTRLAIHVATEASDEYVDGACFIDLSAVNSNAYVAQTVATAVGVKEQIGHKLTDSLIEHFRSRSALLVLDNCEHLIDGCASLVNALLSECGQLRILSTSRQILNIRGEKVRHVPPLALPDTDETSSESLAEFGAISLFISEAQAARPTFSCGEPEMRSVLRICRMLDGIPLAIELAAARIRVLSAQQIEARLDDRFHLLTTGRRATLPRQQTLRSAIDWSYELLTEPERTLWCKLAVFSGRWDLDAAEAVCSGEGLAAGNILDLLSQLLDKSLVLVEEVGSGQLTYRMLDTIRQYGMEKLQSAGEAERYHIKHAKWYLEFAESAAPHLVGPDDARWLNLLEHNIDNLRAANDWSTSSSGSTEFALRFGAALWRFWEVRGYLSEGRQRMSETLRLEDSRIWPELRAKVLNAAGNLAKSQGDFDAARPLLVENLLISKESGDARNIASALNNLANVVWGQGDLEAARSLYMESLDLHRQQGDMGKVGDAQNNLGNVAWSEGKYEEANEFYLQGLENYKQVKHNLGIAFSLNNLGNVELGLNRLTEARQYYEEGLIVMRVLGHQVGIASILHNLAGIAKDLQETGRARELFAESITRFRELNSQSGLVESLDGMARVCALESRFVHATRLFGAVEALRETHGLPLPQSEQDKYERDLAIARDKMDVTEYQANWNEGRGMDLNAAIEYALLDR